MYVAQHGGDDWLREQPLAAIAEASELQRISAEEAARAGA
jgi:hypothetical protein